jgi:hypothetical protein
MTKRDAATSRVMARATRAAFILFTIMAIFSICFPVKALALEYMALPGQGSGAQPFSIELPTPAYHFDRCESMLNHMRENGTLSENENAVPDNRGLSFIVGVRFALGAPRHAERTASVSVWQPLHGTSQKAIAMNDYESCRKDQALQAASGN